MLQSRTGAESIIRVPTGIHTNPTSVNAASRPPSNTKGPNESASSPKNRLFNSRDIHATLKKRLNLIHTVVRNRALGFPPDFEVCRRIHSSTP